MEPNHSQLGVDSSGANLGSEILERNREIAARDAQIAELIAARDAQIAAAAQEVAVRDAQIAAAAQEVAVRDVQLAHSKLRELRHSLQIIELRCKVIDTATSTVVADLPSDDAGPRWEFSNDLIDALNAAFSTIALEAITSAIVDAVHGCSHAENDAPERPPAGYDCSIEGDNARPHAKHVTQRAAATAGSHSRSSNSPLRSIHSHVGEVLRRIVAALAKLEGKFGVPVGFASHFALLYERHYNDRQDLQAPDFSFVVTDTSGRPQLSSELQLIIVECKVRQVLSHCVPCAGERQAAGYAAQRLQLILHFVTDPSTLDASPLVADALFTDTVTSTLVRLTLTSSGVSIHAHRMPFLPQCRVPPRTAGADGGSGAVTCALALLLSLQSHALQSKLFTDVIFTSGLSDSGESSVIPAKLCGRGRFGLVYAFESKVVKVPSSRRGDPTSWAAHCATEYSALRILGRQLTECQHIPSIVFCEAVRHVYSADVLSAIRSASERFSCVRTADPAVAEVLPFVSFTVGKNESCCVALVTQPYCASTLHTACWELGRAGLYDQRELSCFVLSVLIPVASAVELSRHAGVCHGDISTKNVAFETWNAQGYLAAIRNAVHSEGTAIAKSRHRVMLLDWGCAEGMRRGNVFADKSHARDVLQCIDLTDNIITLVAGKTRFRELPVGSDGEPIDNDWLQGIKARALAVIGFWAPEMKRDSSSANLSVLSEVEFVLYGENCGAGVSDRRRTAREVSGCCCAESTSNTVELVEPTSAADRRPGKFSDSDTLLALQGHCNRLGLLNTGGKTMLVNRLNAHSFKSSLASSKSGGGVVGVSGGSGACHETRSKTTQLRLAAVATAAAAAVKRLPSASAGFRRQDTATASRKDVDRRHGHEGFYTSRLVMPVFMGEKLQKGSAGAGGLEP